MKAKTDKERKKERKDTHTHTHTHKEPTKRLEEARICGDKLLVALKVARAVDLDELKHLLTLQLWVRRERGEEREGGGEG